MTVDDHTLSNTPAGTTQRARGRDPKPGGIRFRRRRDRPPRPRIRKLRLLMIIVAFLAIAGVAGLFGLLTAVASDLPQIENQVQFHDNVDSVLYDDTGKPIGVLAPPDAAVIDTYPEISRNMVHAIVSVEDKDFWSDPGIDVKSLLRAFLSDIGGGPKEGASTIAEEFVKNALAEEHNRTVFEKLREAGMAFQLVHRWPRSKILTEYLNIIYFGNGAYGIESAARLYFGKQLGYNANNPSGGRCGTATAADPKLPTCASLLKPYQAALLAGMVANPYAFNPVYYPTAARERRDLVLQDMYHQHYITEAQYTSATAEPVPNASDIQQPSEPPAAPYFTSWVRPQIISALEKEGVPANDAQYEAYYGGLKIKLTINLQMQQAAQAAVNSWLPANSGGPTASLVSIDNKTGEVRAMVSGNGDYSTNQFNYATLGYRQPGSSFKLFTLATALESGDYGPSSVITSKPLDIPYSTPDGTEHFIVHNDGNTYSGPITLQQATDISDNTVFAQVGMQMGTPKIAAMAKAMGVRSPVSTNPAMIIGGLNQGVSALDMAHAYETLAEDGRKIYNPVLGDVDHGPIGIHSIAGCADCDSENIVNTPSSLQVLPADTAETIQQMLEGVVTQGTGTAAQIPGTLVWGKTGTTSNYVDAWFCGSTSQLTTCVWVGYPGGGKPMLTNWNGQPVSGGDFPAHIWQNYMSSALGILADEQSGSGTSTATTATGGVTPQSALGSGATRVETTGAATTGAATTGTATPGATPATAAATTPANATPAPAATTPAATPTPVQTTPVQATPTPTPTPPATPTPAPTTGSGSSSGTGGAGLGG